MGRLSRQVFRGPVCRANPLSLIETLVLGELSRKSSDVFEATSVPDESPHRSPVSDSGNESDPLRKPRR